MNEISREELERQAAFLDRAAALLRAYDTKGKTRQERDMNNTRALLDLVCILGSGSNWVRCRIAEGNHSLPRGGDALGSAVRPNW